MSTVHRCRPVELMVCNGLLVSTHFSDIYLYEYAFCVVWSSTHSSPIFAQDGLMYLGIKADLIHIEWGQKGSTS